MPRMIATAETGFGLLLTAALLCATQAYTQQPAPLWGNVAARPPGVCPAPRHSFIRQDAQAGR
ncbi:MAG: hypothetical protein P4K86_03145 [Terracidiphilus sp.]|nr:hypothetical protein [Terracidiphilus sp.]